MKKRFLLVSTALINPIFASDSLVLVNSQTSLASQPMKIPDGAYLNSSETILKVDTSLSVSPTKGTWWSPFAYTARESAKDIHRLVDQCRFFRKAVTSKLTLWKEYLKKGQKASSFKEVRDLDLDEELKATKLDEKKLNLVTEALYLYYDHVKSKDGNKTLPTGAQIEAIFTSISYETNVLLQLNTGEGKTYVNAVLA
ncbi:MAG: hypothetical protein KBD63_06625, partial [Bacteriovoracaceae bacterium]|nr:hypothetical protein [Bacteriovoracaceae bacterium]